MTQGNKKNVQMLTNPQSLNVIKLRNGTLNGKVTMYQFKIKAARALAERTGMGELQAYRQIQMQDAMERRSGEDRRVKIRDMLIIDRRGE